MAAKKPIKRNKQQEKRVRQDARINTENRKKISKMRTVNKKVVQGGNPSDISVAYKNIDSAQAKGLISKNKAARDKSRIAKKVLKTK
jgi:small subunit ribosomal protein S20